MRRRSFLAFLGATCGAAFPTVGFAAVSHAQPQQNEQNAQQPLSTLDREFLTVIRFANLWETPVSDLVAERGTTQRVRDVGATLATDHRNLDIIVKDFAGQFGVPLPDTPSSSTQKWMDEIEAASGQALDKVYVDRVRAAHGSVFSLIAEIRGGTRNSAIRDFATSANTIVMKHMTLLESTGLVTADHGMFSEASARTIDTPENSLSGGDIVLGGVVATLAAAATIGVVRTFSAPGPAE
jgi:putative membrane protein